MASLETFTFTTEQFLTLIAAIAGAVLWITYKIRGVEKDVENMQKDLEKDPYLKAFKQLEEKHASELADQFDKRLNIWEDQKKREEEGNNKI